MGEKGFVWWEEDGFSMGNGAFMAGSGGFREAKRALTWRRGWMYGKSTKIGLKTLQI